MLVKCVGGPSPAACDPGIWQALHGDGQPPVGPVPCRVCAGEATAVVLMHCESHARGLRLPHNIMAALGLAPYASHSVALGMLPAASPSVAAAVELRLHPETVDKHVASILLAGPTDALDRTAHVHMRELLQQQLVMCGTCIAVRIRDRVAVLTVHALIEGNSADSGNSPTAGFGIIGAETIITYSAPEPSDVDVLHHGLLAELRLLTKPAHAMAAMAALAVLRGHVLVTGPPGVGKNFLVRAALRGCRAHILSCIEAPDAGNQDWTQLSLATVPVPGARTIVVLTHLGLLAARTTAAQRVVAAIRELDATQVQVIGIAHRAGDLPSGLRAGSGGVFTREIQVPLPSLDNRDRYFNDMLVKLNIAVEDLSTPDVAAALAGRTQGCTVRDLERICHRASTAAAARGGPVAMADLDQAVRVLRPPALQAYAVAERTTAPIFFGYNATKALVRDTFTALLSPARRRLGARMPSGLLLHGPSGCGKSTLMAEMAASIALPFISVTASSLLSRYLGETEARIRQLFAAARRALPCVVLIDEVDSLAPRRGARLSSGGLEERILAQLLSELDGINDSQGLFIVGCTNRPLEDIDEAMLRPGRLETMVPLPLPSETDRREIIFGLAAKAVIDPTADLAFLVARTAGRSGADIAAMFRKASIIALRNRRASVADADLREASFSVG
eukprot:m.257378 g.257378  ORF g.257378 m.257378 type:complete len:677 (-) comp20807_c0_seq1:184-2214(-)